MPCRISRSRLWTHRLMLESLKHAESSFVTLTYSNEFGPISNSLNPRHLQLFLKKLRSKISPRNLRYFLVGEYGDLNSRPHFHVALFGYGHCESRIANQSCQKCVRCKLIKGVWNYGQIDLGELNKDSASYIAGYITKKMTNPKNEHVKQWLKGRHPEFARMSLRPGIGAPAMEEVSSVLTSEHGCNQIALTGDVPLSLNHGGRPLPLGRYLRGILRKKVGNADVMSKESLQRYSLEMSQLFKETLSEKNKQKLYKNASWRTILVEENKQKVLNKETKFKIFSQKKGL